ncbi:hypothetical protein C367_02515 [Cryptococcus neoformans Ze90-1]|nr:hypothetical protein C367_02515 [Cryptococcus neoformans var. grubii Ze90-1]
MAHSVRSRKSEADIAFQDLLRTEAHLGRPRQCQKCYRYWPWATFRLDRTDAHPLFCLRCSRPDLYVKHWQTARDEMRTLIDAAAKIQEVYTDPNEAVKPAPPFLPPPQMSQHAPHTLPGAVAQREAMMRPPTFAQDRMNPSSIVNLTDASRIPPVLDNAPLVPATYRAQASARNAPSSAEASSRPWINTLPQYPIERPRQTPSNPALTNLQPSRIPVNFTAPPRAIGQPFLPTPPASTGAINNSGSSHPPSHVSRWPVHVYLPGYSPYQLPFNSFQITKLPDKIIHRLVGKPEELRALKEPHRALLWLQLICVPSPSSVLLFSQIMHSYISFIFYNKAATAPAHLPLLPADLINVMRNLWPEVRYTGGERGTEIICIGLAMRTDKRTRQATSGMDAEVENTRSSIAGPSTATRGDNVGEGLIAMSGAAVSTMAQPAESTHSGSSKKDVDVLPSQGSVPLGNQPQQESRGAAGGPVVSSTPGGTGP